MELRLKLSLFSKSSDKSTKVERSYGTEQLQKMLRVWGGEKPQRVPSYKQKIY